LSSVAWLWTRMDLSVTRRGKVGYPAIRSYINRSNGIIAQAVLDNIADSIIDRVLVLLSRCQKLIHLDIRVPCGGERLFELFKNSKNLKTLLTTSEIGMTKPLFANFLKELPNLEQFQSFRPAGSPLGKVSWPNRLPKLKYLSLSCTGNEIFYGRQMFHVPYYDSLYDDRSHAGKQSRLKLLFKSLPNLEHLCLHCTGNRLHLTNSYFVNFDDICFPNLRRIDLTGALISGSPTSLSASLEYIRISHCRAISTITSDNDVLGLNAATGDQATPFEQQIDYNDQSADEHSLSLNGVRSINPHFPNLHTVIFDDITSFPLDYLSFFVEDSKTLRTFEISACEGVNGVVVAAFANVGPSLENVTTLRLGGETTILPKVDDFTIEQLMGNMPSLKNLIIPWSQVTGVTIKNIVQARQFSAKTDNLDEKVQLVQQPRQSYNRQQQQQEENETGEEQERLQAGESADARPHHQTRSQTFLLPHVEVLDVRGCSGISLEAINYGRKHGLKIVNC
jgi:F-box/TPR repeat protein Pof3